MIKIDNQTLPKCIYIDNIHHIYNYNTTIYNQKIAIIFLMPEQIICYCVPVFIYAA